MAAISFAVFKYVHYCLFSWVSTRLCTEGLQEKNSQTHKAWWVYFPWTYGEKYKEIHKSNKSRGKKHGMLYFQTCVMQMLRTTAVLVQRTNATADIFHRSACGSFQGRGFSLGPASLTRQLHDKGCFSDGLQMHMCSTMWGTQEAAKIWLTLFFFYLLTGTCTISRKAAGKRPGSIRQSCTACNCRVHAGQLRLFISAMQKPKCYIS